MPRAAASVLRMTKKMTVVLLRFSTLSEEVLVGRAVPNS